ncbi:hypothetical protein [Paenibacillus elgii]|uniref:hypothetical protein n=1 Tax=Paenibacillus elgii TaxID=189691 RepID=UPI0013D706D9|nr:hypothetical protein [Paenibacillus elgii]
MGQEACLGAAVLRPFPGQAQESTGFYSVESYEIVRTIVVSGRLNCGETDVFFRASASLFFAEDGNRASQFR